jgi:hypothetical protein
MYQDAGPKRAEAAMSAMLHLKQLDIAAPEQAYAEG